MMETWRAGAFETCSDSNHIISMTSLYVHMNCVGLSSCICIYSTDFLFLKPWGCACTLCKAIHVQRNNTCQTVIPRNCTCVKQVLIGWKLFFGYKVQRQQIHRTVERFSTNYNPEHRMSPSVWLVDNRSNVRCICCRWTSYPKIQKSTFSQKFAEGPLDSLSIKSVNIIFLLFVFVIMDKLVIKMSWSQS